MQNSKFLQHPIIEVAIGGTVVEKRPSEFKLITHAGINLPLSYLLYPADAGVGNVDDEITVSLVADDITHLYFTGKICSANVHGKYRELLLADGFQKLCRTDYAAAYRKEKAANILDDILGAAGITEKSITCPDVELARFSTQTIPARMCISLLVGALKEHGAEELNYFFDEKDIFHFGTADDSGKNEGETFSFETGKNILRSGSGWIEVLPCPIRHSQAVTVNEKSLVTVRTDLTVSRKATRLVLWLREAA
jgi:hypothetical protein